MYISALKGNLHGISLINSSSVSPQNDSPVVQLVSNTVHIIHGIEFYNW